MKYFIKVSSNRESMIEGLIKIIRKQKANTKAIKRAITVPAFTKNPTLVTNTKYFKNLLRTSDDLFKLRRGFEGRIKNKDLIKI